MQNTGGGGGRGGGGGGGGDDLGNGAGNNENDHRVNNGASTDSYMTPAHYSGYDEPSEYHNLPQDHQNPHSYNLDGSPEFYSSSGIHLEAKYQPPPFKNYPRGKNKNKNKKCFSFSPSLLYRKLIIIFIFNAGRYHEGYSEGGYGQYDATPFQTVPGSGNQTSGTGGTGVAANDQWTVGQIGEHLTHHPAFLAGLGPRDTTNSHHPTSIGNNPDQKPLLQSAMLTGYTGKKLFNNY